MAHQFSYNKVQETLRAETPDETKVELVASKIELPP